MTGTIPAWLSNVVAGQPDRPAVFHEAEVSSYGDFWARSRRVASGLLERGEFTPGRKVGVVGANSPDFLTAYFGVLRAQGVVVPLNARLSPEELGEQLRFVEAAGCIVGDVDADVAEAF